MSGYIGSTPVPQATQHRESFTCTEGQTSFATAGYTPQFLDVFLNGSHLSPADFVATNSSDVVLVVAASADDVCDIVSYTPFEVAGATFTGTTNLDAVDIDGAVQLDSTLTVGVDDTGYDVKFFGATASAFMQWDASTDDLILGGASRLGIGTASPSTGLSVVTGSANGIELGQDSDASTDSARLFFSTSNGSNAIHSSNGIMRFFTGSTAGSSTGTERFRIAADGSLSTPTAGTSNVRFGVNAGDAIDGNGAYNVFVGDEAGTSNTSGIKNVALGMDALETNVDGDGNVAVGYQALKTMEPANGFSFNTAVGAQAGLLVNTGTNNTFVGGLAGDGTDDGGGNTAVGHSALSANCGDSNVAIGASAGALITGSSNTCVGQNAGSKIADAAINICIGASAGAEITTGASNIVIGYLAGRHGINLATGDNNLLIGNYSDTTATDTDNANVIGYNVSGEGGYTTLGFGGDDIRAAHGNDDWNAVSDERLKKNITSATAGLAFINSLRPVTWEYKTLGELPETFRAYEADSTEVFKNSNTNHGFIAQEVKAAIDADSSIKDGFSMWGERPDGCQEVAKAALIPMLAKAVQELSTALDAALARIATLEG